MSVDGGRSILGFICAPLPSVVGIHTFNSIGDVAAGSHVLFYGLFRPMIPWLGFVVQASCFSRTLFTSETLLVRNFPPCPYQIIPWGKHLHLIEKHWNTSPKADHIITHHISIQISHIPFKALSSRILDTSTAFSFDPQDNYTFELKGALTVAVEGSCFKKFRLTCILCASADGYCFPPMILVSDLFVKSFQMTFYAAVSDLYISRTEMYGRDFTTAMDRQDEVPSEIPHHDLVDGIEDDVDFAEDVFEMWFPSRINVLC
ncbi:hypothetical protein RCL1_008719 [Eukaryota sp. TZLM3-RCL]